ncbi:MAG: hypothetical protein IJI45_11485 [Anaerolineaceae bacterium]|nr:hypothetical protein [Anaerolineaceae bacterium]
MAYIQERFLSADKNILIVKKYHNLFAMPTKESLRKKRGPAVNQTTESQKKKNERHRKEKNMRLLIDNFQAGDYYITFTTAEKLTAEEFKAEMKNFMRRLRREYERRMGEKLKYFRVMENLIGRGRPHAHMLIPKFCPAEIIRGLLDGMWSAGHVRVDIYGGKAQDAYNVASYFSKQEKKEHGAKIDTSRGNLIRKKPKKEIIHRETFREEIIAPKGYYVVKPLSHNIKTDAGDYQIAVYQKIERVKSVNDRTGRMAEKSIKKISRCSKPKSRNAS